MARRSTQKSLLRWQIAATISIACAGGLYAKQLVDERKAQVPPNHYGQPIALANELLAHSPDPVPEVRTGCITSRPGSAPFNVNHDTGAKWERRAKAALLQAAVPLEVQTEFIRRVRAGEISDSVQLSNGGGMALTSRQRYLPRYTGTYTLAGRDVVCHDTRLAMRPGETTGGALFLIKGYHLVIQQACGNVDRHFPGNPDGPVVTNVFAVPEPGSSGLVFLGLLGLLIRRRSA